MNHYQGQTIKCGMNALLTQGHYICEGCEYEARDCICIEWGLIDESENEALHYHENL